MTYKFNYTKDVLNASYFEGVQALADVFGVHRNTVSRAIQSLKGLGYIQVTTNKGSSNVYNKVTTWLNCKPPVLVVKSESESVPNQTRNKTTKHAPVEQVVADNNFWIDDEPF
jgi:DNA-binding GntR family transcriptional regulator